MLENPVSKCLEILIAVFKIFLLSILGIVRGVAKDKIYLLTPLSLEELDNINCIANCTQALPLNMLTKVGPEIKGHAPFVNLKRDRPITANIPKRNYYLQRSFTNRSAKET